MAESSEMTLGSWTQTCGKHFLQVFIPGAVIGEGFPTVRTNLVLINIIIIGIHVFSLYLLNVANAVKDCEDPPREES